MFKSNLFEIAKTQQANSVSNAFNTGTNSAASHLNPAAETSVFTQPNSAIRTAPLGSIQNGLFSKNLVNSACGGTLGIEIDTNGGTTISGTINCEFKP